MTEQRILEYAARLPDDGAVTGWASLLLHGGNHFDGRRRSHDLPVPLVIPPHRNLRPHPGLIRIRARLPPSETTVRHGVRCTIPERALFDEMARARDVRAAAIEASLACSAALTSRDRFREYVTELTCISGLVKVRDALPLITDRARSRFEVSLMLTWCLDAELPTPLMNWPVMDVAGRFLGSPDLLCAELGVYGEFDGAGHRDLTVHSDDVDRDARFAAAGLHGFRVVASDFAHAKVLDRILSTVELARHDQRPRRWYPHPDPRPLVRVG